MNNHLNKPNYNIWEVQNSEFKSFTITPTENALILIKTLTTLQLPINTSLFIRGSYLENDFLYPNSDIDLMIVGIENYENLKNQINNVLSFLKIPIDIVILSKQEIESNAAYRLLLQTRAYLISGEKIILTPIKANFDTMKHFYFHYKPFFIPEILYRNQSSCFTFLKQLTRSFGVIYFLKHGNQFSRDIKTCIQWAKEIDFKIGVELEQIWERFDKDSGSESYEIKNILASFFTLSDQLTKKHI